MVERAVARALDALGLRQRHLLVAVSGGVDSTVLACVLRALASDYGLRLSIGHVNHGLRGEESEADAKAVEALATRFGLAFRAARVDPHALREAGPSRSRPTLQEAARRLRYDALLGMAGALEADHIATAHHLDDQAETVLLRLLRGAAPQGLGGIPERSADGWIVRPLLDVPRAEIEAYARERRLAWREDRSNQSRDYARNRLRADWLPGLAQAFNPRLSRALGDLAEAQRRDSEWIEAHLDLEAARRFESKEGGLVIRSADWSTLAPALARRLARRALRVQGAGRDVSRVHLERMIEFLGNGKAGKVIELPGGLVLKRMGADSWLGPGAETAPGAC